MNEREAKWDKAIEGMKTSWCRHQMWDGENSCAMGQLARANNMSENSLQWTSPEDTREYRDMAVDLAGVIEEQHGDEIPNLGYTQRDSYSRSFQTVAYYNDRIAKSADDIIPFMEKARAKEVIS